MTVKILTIAMAAIIGGAVVALPGVSEAIRSGLSGAFGRQKQVEAARTQPASSAPEKDEADKNSSKSTSSESNSSGAAANQGSENDVRLTAEQIKLIGLKTTVARRMPIEIGLMLNGEVTPNQDRTVQILPRVPGIVREVLKTLGDRVRANEPVAIIESRELAETEAVYLGAKSKSELAQRQLEREETLFNKKITAEQDFLTAKQAAEAAAIELRAAEQKLTLLGLDPRTAKPRQSGTPASVRVPIFAPFDGTLIEKRVAVGDQVTDQTPLFRIANLDQVWVIASVFEKDIARVRLGLSAAVTLRAYPERTFEGKITWVSEVLDEKTRTLRVRVELDNRDGLLKPGSFARVSIKTVTEANGIALPASAVQRQKSENIVFIDAGHGVFKRREVKTGARSTETTEIVEGLEPGETVVTSGSFLLKSELEKSGFADKD